MNRKTCKFHFSSVFSCWTPRGIVGPLRCNTWSVMWQSSHDEEDNPRDLQGLKLLVLDICENRNIQQISRHLGSLRHIWLTRGNPFAESLPICQSGQFLCLLAAMFGHLSVRDGTYDSSSSFSQFAPKHFKTSCYFATICSPSKLRCCMLYLLVC